MMAGRSCFVLLLFSNVVHVAFLSSFRRRPPAAAPLPPHVEIIIVAIKRVFVFQIWTSRHFPYPSPN
jgi:hypothetical protein